MVHYTIWSSPDGGGADKLYECRGGGKIADGTVGLAGPCGRLMTENEWRRHKKSLLSGSSCATALSDKRRLHQTPGSAASLLHAHVATPPPPFPPQVNGTPTLEEGDAAMDFDMPGDKVGLEVAREASPPDVLIFDPYEEEEVQGPIDLEEEEQLNQPNQPVHGPEEEGAAPISLKDMLLRALAAQLSGGHDEGEAAEIAKHLREFMFDQLDEEGLGESLFKILGDDEEDEGGAKGEGSFYDSSNLQEPVFVGSRATKLQYVYKMLQIFVEGGITVTAFNALIGFLSTSVFPSGSRAPNNLNQLKKLILVDQATKFEFSICIHGCHLFSTPCGSSGYASNQERCGCSDPQPRFIRKGKSWKPNGQVRSIIWVEEGAAILISSL